MRMRFCHRFLSELKASYGEMQVLTPAGATTRRKRSSSRLTPYRMPGTGGVIRTEHLNNRLTANQTEVLKRLVAKTSEIYHVSPLWKFETTQKSLQIYSQHLSGLLAGTSPLQQEDLHVAKVSVVSDFGPDGSYAVEVLVRRRNSGRAGPVCVVVLCRMLSSRTVGEGFLNLPLMVVHGLSGIYKVVINWFQNSFDCCIKAMKVDQMCLQLLASKYAAATQILGGRKQGKVGGLELVYNLPDPIGKAGLTSITLGLPYESAMAVSHSAESATSSLHSILEQLVEKHFHLKLSSLTLVQISCPAVQLHHNATVKFCSINHVMSVLSDIQQAML